MKEALFTMPSARVTWQIAIFLLGYVGAEVCEYISVRLSERVCC